MITWHIYSQNMRINEQSCLICHFLSTRMSFTPLSLESHIACRRLFYVLQASFYWLLINIGKHTHYADVMCDIDIALNDYKAISLWINKQHRFNLQHSIMLKNCAASLRHARLCSYTEFYF